MALIPETEVTMADLIEWDACKKELALLKSKEALLRSRIFKHYFPNPKEGTNKVDLAEGWLLKAQHVISRTFDMGALQAACGEEGDFTKAGFNCNPLIKWSAELKTTEYKQLPPDLRTLLETTMIIKPGSPQMEIVLPAATAKAQAAAITKAAK